MCQPNGFPKCTAAGRKAAVDDAAPGCIDVKCVPVRFLEFAVVFKRQKCYPRAEIVGMEHLGRRQPFERSDKVHYLHARSRFESRISKPSERIYHALCCL